jgi:protein required for attachment to host cells
MNLRIVVADERQANFFDTLNPNGPLTPRGSVQNSKAGLKDVDLETDRAGSRFGGSTGTSPGRGPIHHGVDGERSTERHDVELFAKAVAHRIDSGRNNKEFDKLMLIAPPKMLGLLRQSLGGSQSLVTEEISKDIVNQGTDAILRLIPRDAFWH